MSKAAARGKIATKKEYPRRRDLQAKILSEQGSEMGGRTYQKLSNLCHGPKREMGLCNLGVKVDRVWRIVRSYDVRKSLAVLDAEAALANGEDRAAVDAALRATADIIFADMKAEIKAWPAVLSEKRRKAARRAWQLEQLAGGGGDG